MIKINPLAVRRAVSAGALLLGCLLLMPPAAAAPPLAEVTGRVLGFDGPSFQLKVDTRLGPRDYRFNTTTLFLLNNHGATQADVRLGDHVEVSYHYHTSLARRVHLFRERKLRGRVASATTTSIGVTAGGGAVVALRTDANSRIELEGFVVGDRSILVGRPVNAVYEPANSPLLLSLEARARRVSGAITAIDAAARTLTISGRQSLAFTVDAAATLRRDGATATLAAFKIGDLLRVAFTPAGDAGRRALVLEGETPPPPPEKAVRTRE